MKIVRYVAAMDTHDARVRSQQGHSLVCTEVSQAARDAARLGSEDRCEPQCAYGVYMITTEITEVV